jgi:hypothetical protein
MAEASHPDAPLGTTHRELIICGIERGSRFLQHPVVRLDPGADAPRSWNVSEPESNVEPPLGGHKV